jgi:hypothetical protein
MKHPLAKKIALFSLVLLGITGAVLAYQQAQNSSVQNGIFLNTTLNRNRDSNQELNLSQSNPEQTVILFYDWYLNFAGNPLTSGAYLESNYLSERLKEAVALQLADQQMGQADPFLLAQDVPEEFKIVDTLVDDETAAIKMAFTISGQEFFRQIDLIRTNGVWQINQVQMIEGLKRSLENEEMMEAIVYFSNNFKAPEGSSDCGLVYGTSRLVPFTYDLETEIEAALVELFKGPTTKEKELGFESYFSADTAGLLNQFKLVDNTAYLDLNDASSKLRGQNASCSGEALLAQIEETIKHHRSISQVVISSNGSAEEFYEWMQLGCSENNNFCQTVFEN